MEENNENQPDPRKGQGISVFAVLSYMWILCLVPIIMKNEDEDVKFHARQGFMLFIVETVFAFVGVIPLLGNLIGALGILICWLLSLIGIIQVMMGNKWKMPVIGKWAEKLTI